MNVFSGAKAFVRSSAGLAGGGRRPSQPGVPFPGNTGAPRAAWPLGRSPDSGPTHCPPQPRVSGPHPGEALTLRLGPGGTRKGAASAAEWREKAGKPGGRAAFTLASRLPPSRGAAAPASSWGGRTGRAAERPALSRTRRRVPAAARPPRAEREPGSPRVPRDGWPAPRTGLPCFGGRKAPAVSKPRFLHCSYGSVRSLFPKEAGYPL